MVNCDKSLQKLKNINAGYGDIRFKRAEVSQKNQTITAFFVSNIPISESLLKELEVFIQKEAGITWKVIACAEKAVVDSGICKMAVLEYLAKNHQSISHLITINDIKVICAGEKTVYEIEIGKELEDYFSRVSIVSVMDESLARNFSSNFSGCVKIKNTTQETPTKEYQIESVNESDFNQTKKRTVKMSDVTKYCDTVFYDTATCIEDCRSSLGELIIAGTVTEIEKRETKNGKPFFTITVNDKTDSIRGMLFTADKNKVKKTEKIFPGSIIIMRCENQEFNERLSLNIKGYHLCEFPNNYVPEEIESLKPPKEYSLVFPTSAELIKQGNIFTKVEAPSKYLTDNEFVVVDIETTGVNVGADKITEIGAVKIKNGEIVSKFQTLVNPEVGLTEKIVKLTGITDEMLKPAPKIKEVYPDFFKYVDGCVFIAHNAEFDFRFLKTAGKEFGYIMKNKVIDTIEIAHRVLPGMKNYKLNTLCDHYGIEFRHHRALSDAFATAELFLELLKEEDNK